ncbi:RNA-binding protein 33-like isoform X2 [Leptidea sinapis]|uniref:RNA-binding protein 33-like isoform X2 n=1 Tax=Leptidea sinapis TaxID=189913 RepID=UPI002146933F|nr:RNA-binding protein 33-like isoform X2 [Leptidea sinapis]
MSDNEDLLGDDLGDHSLADYNLGNEEEEQLLADDFDGGTTHSVPSGGAYIDSANVVPANFTEQNVNEYQPVHYTMPEAECVVPNITVEVPNTITQIPTYAPYPEPVYDQEHAVPPPIPLTPIDSPQIVPSEIAPASNAECGRERFISERPVGAQRTPQVRNIPDSLDKVYVPRGNFALRGRNSWRNPHFRQNHPYKRNNVPFRGNFAPRQSFPTPHIVRPNLPPMRPDIPELQPEIPQQMPPQSQGRPLSEIRPDFQNYRPPFRPNVDERPNFRPNMDERQNFRPNMDVRPNFNQNFERPNFRPYNNRPFGPTREIVPNNNIPQVIIRQPMLPHMPGKVIEPDVRMLPLQLPPALPGGITGKKVLINPHFKGNFQPPVEGPIKDIDSAAERFIAEQRNALARAAQRNARRSPQRYIENTTIKIENELARNKRSDDDELLRKQEEFINANREGLRRRMRSPSPERRRSGSQSPVRPVRRTRTRSRSPDRRPRPPAFDDEESEYRRRVREQEQLRERVLRAKEVRRRRQNVTAVQTQLRDREPEQQEKERLRVEPRLEPNKENPSSTKEEDTKPDTTRKSPEREGDVKSLKLEKRVEKEISPQLEEEVNSTCEALTPPPPGRSDTPPLPPAARDSDDDLDLILGDIDGILSDDEDTGRFKSSTDKKSIKETSGNSAKVPQLDLRTKLPPKHQEKPKTTSRQKITFNNNENKKKDKSPIRRTIVTSSTRVDVEAEKLEKELKMQTEYRRQRIIFDAKKAQKQAEENIQKSANRRVILQRKGAEKSVFVRMESTDPTKPHPGIFSRAFKSLGTSEVSKSDRLSKSDVKSDKHEPQVEYESESESDDLPQELGLVAFVTNLPHGITDTRLRTLAGDSVQSMTLDKEERSARIVFRTSAAASNFKKKFNSKMVAASRLNVRLE